MTEYERSLYYTDDGIRKQIPLKEKLPYRLFAVIALVDSFLLYGIANNIAGSIALVYCFFYIIFIVLYLKKYKWIKSTTYAATYSNSHDSESWKPVYKRNLKIVIICAVAFIPLAALFVITAYLRF